MKTDKYGKLFNTESVLRTAPVDELPKVINHGEKAPKDFKPCKDHSEEKVKEGSCCREKGNGK